MNEPLRIAVCEDEQEDADLLAQRIKETGVAVKIAFFLSGEAFLRKYRKGLYHLIYLDIYLDSHMENMTGMAVAAAIREQGDGVPVAFISFSQEHALEANKHRSILYIEKPVTTDAIAHTLSIADALRQRKTNEVLSVVDSQRKKMDIPFDDISHIDVLNHRCTLHLASGGEVKVRTATTIDELDTMLPRPRFYRCHRSFIVNFDYVKEPDEFFTFIMANGDRVFSRVKDFDKMKAMYEDYLFEQARGGV